MSKFITGEQFNAGVKQVATALNAKMESLPGKTIVKEISNPLTTSPLEYGYYFLDKDTTTTLEALKNIPFNLIKNGNMQNPIDGVIKLKANKTYEICFDIYGVVSSNTTFRLECYDVDTGEWLIRGGKAPATNTTNTFPVSLNGIITTKKDTNIAFFASQSFTKIYSDYTYVLIKEIRNNPVNQYGGFETEVLFEGKASVNVECELLDDINNYNFLLFETSNEEKETFSIPPMTNDNSPVPLKATASGLINTSYGIWKAFNQTRKDTYDCWLIEGSSGWLQIDTGVNTKAYGVYLSPRIDGAGMKKFTIQGSNDNIIWDDIFYNEEGIPLNGEKYYFNNTVSYRYYKITGERNGSYLAIANFDLLKKSNEFIETSIITVNDKLQNTFHKIYNDTCVSVYQNKFNILESQTPGLKINKVIGIKGQLPSLLCGGEF